jgi:hypothetical protein
MLSAWCRTCVTGVYVQMLRQRVYGYTRLHSVDVFCDSEVRRAETRAAAGLICSAEVVRAL